MKKQLLFLLLCAFISISGLAQSIKITSVLSTPIAAGTALKVDYKYTVAADSYIYCGINLQNDWTYVSFVAGQGLDIAKAGTDVTGSFDISIPNGTIPTANLTGLQNYKINIELKSLPAFNWLAGDYPPTPLTITAATTVAPAITFTAIPTSTQIGTNLEVSFKYTLASAGKVSVLVSKNGGANAYDYISTLVYNEISPAAAGTDVVGTFSVLIPNETIPTANLSGNENYRVVLELKDASDKWLAGDYSKINYSLTPSLSTNQFNFKNDTLAIYPNPVENVLRWAPNSSWSDASFGIYNTAGQIIQKTSKVNSNQIDVSALKPGIYILSVDSKQGQKEVKFIKK